MKPIQIIWTDAYCYSNSHFRRIWGTISRAKIFKYGPHSVRGTISRSTHEELYVSVSKSKRNTVEIYSKNTQ